MTGRRLSGSRRRPPLSMSRSGGTLCGLGCGDAAPAGAAALAGLAALVGGLRSEVDLDAVQEFAVDRLLAAGDGLDRGAADDLRQAADAPSGALEQVGGVVAGQRAGGMVQEHKRLLHGGDDAGPKLAAASVV